MAGEKVAEKGATQFGVFQAPTGSLRFGAVKFRPLTVVETPVAIAKRINPDDAQVKFFATRDKADAEVARLREKFTAKAKAKK